MQFRFGSKLRCIEEDEDGIRARSWNRGEEAGDGGIV